MISQELKRLLVKRRKLPLFQFIGNLDEDWCTMLAERAKTAESTAEASKENNITFDRYDFLEFYDQRKTNVFLPDVFKVFGEVYDLRFGVLEAGKTLPPHVDHPKDLRFIAVLEGEHVFRIVDKVKDERVMKKGELWFINSSYNHEVENTTSDQRIALLGKFKDETQLLRTRA